MKKSEIERHKKGQSLLEQDLNLKKLRNEINDYKRKNKELMEYIIEINARSNFIEIFDSQKASSYSIKPQIKNDSESTALFILSDTHNYKKIRSETINLMNEYNKNISVIRHKNFVKGALSWLKIHRTGTAIKQGILFLGGDFVQGNIVKDDMSENVMQEVLFSYGLLVFVIDELSKEFDNFLILCCDGNHSRITEKKAISMRCGNSLEYLLYHFLAKNYKNNKKITFKIAEGYFLYQNIYGFKYRFHHGDALRYLGGIGGLTVSANRGILFWNKTINVDKDIICHFHQFLNERLFLCNGSLCGYDPYAEYIKATYELPMQTFALINKRYGMNVASPIYV